MPQFGLATRLRSSLSYLPMQLAVTPTAPFSGWIAKVSKRSIFAGEAAGSRCFGCGSINLTN